MVTQRWTGMVVLAIRARRRGGDRRGYGYEGAPPKAPGYTRGTMKAIVRYRYGSPDVLELRDIEKPEVADEEVLVRVQAAGVDRGVWHIMTGLPTPFALRASACARPRTPL